MSKKKPRKNNFPYRIGLGYDIHRLAKGRKLFLGGGEIPHAMGLLGHSDADALLHAVCDALLGAVGAGDIGEHFPDTDRRYRGISSTVLLKNVFAVVRSRGYAVVNVDAVILAEEPKITPHKENMRRCISAALTIKEDAVNIKATTQEGLGFGQKGIAAYAVVLLAKE